MAKSMNSERTEPGGSSSESADLASLATRRRSRMTSRFLRQMLASNCLPKLLLTFGNSVRCYVHGHVFVPPFALLAGAF